MREAARGGGIGGGGVEDTRGKAQLVLQLAQWVQALGQGGRDEIMRECRAGGGALTARVFLGAAAARSVRDLAALSHLPACTCQPAQ